MMRDEGLYLEEWIAFHRVAGIGSIRIYDNGSSDATRDIVARASLCFPVEIVDWTHIRDTHDMVQKAAFDDGARHFTGRSDFVAFIDADEFVFCEGRTSIPDALERFGANVGAIAVNQRVFGSSGLREVTPGLVTSRFIRRAASQCSEHLYFKTIARPECVTSFETVHSVSLSRGDYVYSDGTALQTVGGHSGKAAHIRFGELRLNHYPLKSLAEFRLKQARFSQTDIARDYDSRYFVNRLIVANAVQDHAAASRAGEVITAIRAISPNADLARYTPPEPKVGSVVRNLICDIGMSEGNDTQFYLDKGFDVVGVEADPIMFDALIGRFQTAIADGRLTLIHRAAADTDEVPLTFYRNDREQGHSSLNPSHAAGDKREFDVLSINWDGLRAIRGVPYYLKIDVETAEEAFLNSMRDRGPLPTFISVECHEFRNIELLYGLGYRKFKLVNQTILHTFASPQPSLEGSFVGQPNWQHGSGPFGLELPGDRWFDFREIAGLFDLVNRLRDLPTFVAPCWFDCHATHG